MFYLYFFSKTIELVRRMEKCGVTFLTVHGRTPMQRTKEPSNKDFLREVKQSMSIPLVANGDCKSLDDANEMFEKINCNGVMAARGILSNPTLFSGLYPSTPVKCVQDWTNLAHEAGDRITFQCFHHHLTFMMEKLVKRRDRAIFNTFSKKEQVYDFLNEKLNVVPENTVNSGWSHVPCEYDDTKYKQRVQIQVDEEAKRYNSDSTFGKFFLSQLDDDSDGDGDTDGLNCLFND